MDQKQFNTNLGLFLLFAVVMAVVVLVGISQLAHQQSLSPKATGDTLTGSFVQDRYEARAWLKANPNTTGSPFATNRFPTLAQARAFVEMLYTSGAVKVEVTNISAEDWRLKSEGSSYADMLVVTLPAERQQRLGIFGIANQEAEQAGQGTVTDVGQDELTLWWD